MECVSHNKKLIKDITGVKSGRLTVINFDHCEKGLSFWKCSCECGGQKIIRRTSILSKRTRSCGKCKFGSKPADKNPKFKNLLGQKFGKLTAIEIHRTPSGFSWKCLCDCGKITISTPSRLIKGIKTHCGCSRKKPKLKKKTQTENLKGLIFDNYRVINSSKKKNKNSFSDAWECKCDCGKISILFPWELKKSRPSKRCKHCFKDYNGGSRNIHWNKNLTEEERLNARNRRLNPLNKEWVKKVYERDGYICQVTKKTGNICAHHLKSWHAFPQNRYEIENGITILESVHKAFHDRCGRKYNTPEQFQIFVKNLTREQIESFPTRRVKRLLTEKEKSVIIDYIINQIKYGNI